MKPQRAGWVEQLAKPVTFAGKSDGIASGISLFRSIFDDLSACGKYTPLPATLTRLSWIADRRKLESDTTLL
jgi:hypothetical protein